MSAATRASGSKNVRVTYVTHPLTQIASTQGHADACVIVKEQRPQRVWQWRRRVHWRIYQLTEPCCCCCCCCYPASQASRFPALPRRRRRISILAPPHTCLRAAFLRWWAAAGPLHVENSAALYRDTVPGVRHGIPADFLASFYDVRGRIRSGVNTQPRRQ